jgi:opacity protein-like surface antigen
MVEEGGAEVGFWVGPKGIYFRPSNENIQKMYRPFLGWGGNVGWVLKHLEMSAEMTYLHTRWKESSLATDIHGNIFGEFWWGLSTITVTPRVAYRLWSQRTPYLGIGAGYHRTAWKLEGIKIWEMPDLLQQESSSELSTNFFGGYDYRLFKWIGLRAEGEYRIAEAKVQRVGYSIKKLDGLGVNFGAYAIW